MDIKYKFDYLLIAIVLLAIAGGSWQILRGKIKITSVKDVFSPLFIGLSLPIISVLIEYFFYKNRGSDYIFSLLLLKRVDILVPIGYILVGLGIASLIALIRNKTKWIDHTPE